MYVCMQVRMYVCMYTIHVIYHMFCPFISQNPSSFDTDKDGVLPSSAEPRYDSVALLHQNWDLDSTAGVEQESKLGPGPKQGLGFRFYVRVSTG